MLVLLTLAPDSGWRRFRDGHGVGSTVPDRRFAASGMTMEEDRMRSDDDTWRAANSAIPPPIIPPLPAPNGALSPPDPPPRTAANPPIPRTGV